MSDEKADLADTQSQMGLDIRVNPETAVLTGLVTVAAIIGAAVLIAIKAF